MRLTLSRESWRLVAVCIADAVLTAVLLTAGLAQEANPLMAYCLRYGLGTFFLVKIGTVVLAVGTAELYRRHNPAFVARTLKTVTAVYIGVFLTAFLAANIP